MNGMPTNRTRNPMREDSASIPIKIVNALRRSFFLSLSVFGAVLIILGMTVFDDVLAGMLGIWGLTALLIGGGVYTITWSIRE